VFFHRAPSVAGGCRWARAPVEAEPADTKDLQRFFGWRSLLSICWGSDYREDSLLGMTWGNGDFSATQYSMELKLWWHVENTMLLHELDGKHLIRSWARARDILVFFCGSGPGARTRCPMALRLWWRVENTKILHELDGKHLIRSLSLARGICSQKQGDAAQRLVARLHRMMRRCRHH